MKILRVEEREGAFRGAGRARGGETKKRRHPLANEELGYAGGVNEKSALSLSWMLGSRRKEISAMVRLSRQS